MGTRATTERSDTWGGKAGEAQWDSLSTLGSLTQQTPGRGVQDTLPACAGSGCSKRLKEMRDKSKDVVKMLLVVLI